MDIIPSTESCVLKLGGKKNYRYRNHPTKCKYNITKYLNLKLISNLRFESRKALKNQNNGRMKIYPFGKGYGFGTLEDKTTKLKFEKQLGKIIQKDTDLTQKLTTKI